MRVTVSMEFDGPEGRIVVNPDRYSGLTDERGRPRPPRGSSKISESEVRAAGKGRKAGSIRRAAQLPTDGTFEDVADRVRRAADKLPWTPRWKRRAV